VLDVARYDVAKLGEAILAGQVARALRILDGLRTEGEAPALVLWTLADQITGLARVRAGLDAGRPLPLAMSEARVFGLRQKLFERALPMLAAYELDHWVEAAAVCDGLVKGLSHPDWPADPWDSLARLVLTMLQPMTNTTRERAPAARLALRA
jgi:DNA polymerase-3 subunit delta